MVKAGDDNIRSELPDDPYHVLQYFFLVPYFQGFIRYFRISKIIGPAEKLLSSVYFPRFYQFLGAYYAKEFPEFLTLPLYEAME